MSSSSSDSEQSFDSENTDLASENLQMDSGNEDKLVIKSVLKQAIANANKENFMSAEEEVD